MSQSTSGEWTLSASDDLKAEALEFGLDCLKQTPHFLIPGEPDEIAAAVKELTAATSRPPWMDDEVAITYDAALNEALKDYPIDVVQLACKRWRMVPQHGKWWPTEQDLRQQCEMLFQPRRSLFNKARALLQNLRIREDEQRRTKTSAFAGRKQDRFRELMRQRMSPSRHEAYFHYAYLMFSGEDELIVSNRCAESVLTEEGGDLLRDLGLRVVFDPKPFANVRRPTHEDDTPEERAEVAAKLRRLKEGIEKGADLKRLRDAGLI